MLNKCDGPRIVVADGHKIGKEHNFVSGKISLITHLVTDNSADEDHLQLLKESGVEVFVVNPHKTKNE